MVLQNNRSISISVANSRRAVSWATQKTTVSALFTRLSTPQRGTETMSDYLQLSKAKQDDLKDVGGFVGGVLRDGRRKAENVLGRDLLTLDMDNVPAGGTREVLSRVEVLGCCYAVYSTRKHTPEKPRLRVVIPLDRTVPPDEYEPIGRKIAECIGMEYCDVSTFEAWRLMYWPSCCSDAEYVFEYSDQPLANADAMLSLYDDWHDVTSWPAVPGAADVHTKTAARQGDPEAKKGVVGSFCRKYDIYKAMDELLPGVYEPTDIPGRYTFIGGSTAGGAVLYDNGKYLYSHHATDPCSGRLVNSFDLVRLHKFSSKDDDAKADTPVNKLPSFQAMLELAAADPDVSASLVREKYEEATEEFKDLLPETVAEDNHWQSMLQVSAEGHVLKTAENARLILELDPYLAGKLAYDAFANRGAALGALPWDTRTERRAWTDNDDSGARWYLEKTYSLTGKEKINDALSLSAHAHEFDEVREYLEGLAWDGTPRLDTLLIDYLGAADNVYNRAVTRKAFTAAVARVMTPGCKFDHMTILTGPQGIGKSTLLKTMGRGWFSDSIKTFEGKEASELVQGVWLVEIGELEAFNKSEIGRIKQFLSQCEDIFRAAYGRHVGWYPRRCVFFGTSNNGEYLRDKTGNRRFWPVDLAQQEATKDIFEHLEAEVDQLWAEAVARWKLGELLFLSGDLAKTAYEEQEAHRERSPREGLIREFVERPVPEGWSAYSLQERRMYWAGDSVEIEDVVPVPRDKICSMEVWCEALNGDVKAIKYTDAVEINAVIASMEGWKRMKKTTRFGYYGAQKGFQKDV